MTEDKVDEMGLTAAAAAGYQEYFVPALFWQWPPLMLSAARVKTGDTVLDVGCGTGVLSREALAVVGEQGSVTGLDLSGSMLGVARTVVPGADFQQGDVCGMPFADASFDAVVSSFMLMFVPEPGKAISEMWRVLQPGGRLVVGVWDALTNSPVYSALVAIARERAGEDAAQSLAWPFTLGTQGQLEQLFSGVGIGPIDISVHEGSARFPSLEEFVRTEIQAWLLAQSVDESGLDAMIADAGARFSDYIGEDGSMEFPIAAKVVSVQKS